MKILAVDRSTDVQTVALSTGDGAVAGAIVPGDSFRSSDWAVKVRDFVLSHGVALSDLDRIVVGTGPGSFAGIRGAISFAQGLALGMKAKRPELAADPVVWGLESPMAMTDGKSKVAVVGDARRGLFWVSAYDGLGNVRKLGLVEAGELASAIPEGFAVVTPDEARIGAKLRETFGERYAGGCVPSAERMVRMALSSPGMLMPEPLPVYLSPAVRTPPAQ